MQMDGKEEPVAKVLRHIRGNLCCKACRWICARTDPISLICQYRSPTRPKRRVLLLIKINSRGGNCWRMHYTPHHKIHGTQVMMLPFERPVPFDRDAKVPVTGQEFTGYVHEMLSKMSDDGSLRYGAVSDRFTFHMRSDDNWSTRKDSTGGRLVITRSLQAYGDLEYLRSVGTLSQYTTEITNSETRLLPDLIRLIAHYIISRRVSNLKQNRLKEIDHSWKRFHNSQIRRRKWTETQKTQKSTGNCSKSCIVS